MGKSTRSSRNYKMWEEVIMKRKKEKDLGVIIQDNLSPERHMNEIFNKTYNLFANIRVTFHHMNQDMMKKIMTAIVCLRLEYSLVV